jgi:poly(hydroxyalkanoate) depolymerase family esterase
VHVLTGEYAGAEGTRRWRLAVPAGHRATTPRPMLVMLHGCLQDAADIARGSRLDALASEAGALVLYPEQPESANPRKCWNWFDPAHQHRGAGEPALLAALIDRVAMDHGADPSRIHLAGVSAGAAMATLLAVAYPERYQSLMSASGIGWRSAPSIAEALSVMQRGAGEQLPTPVQMAEAMGTRARAFPVLVVHGAADHVVSIRNATELAQQFVGLHDGLRTRANQPALQRVELEPVTEGEYTVREQQWRDSDGRAMVTLLRIEELGHAWSAGDASGSFTDPKGPVIGRRIAALIG